MKTLEYENEKLKSNVNYKYKNKLIELTEQNEELQKKYIIMLSFEKESTPKTWF